MDAVFLDDTLPGFEEKQKELLDQGYVEKKNTKSTAEYIKQSYKIYRLKEEVPPWASPEIIDFLTHKIERELPGRLYKEKDGVQVFKIHMYVPGPKLENLLKKESNKAMELVHQVEESFAHENYGRNFEAQQKELEKRKKKNARINEELAMLMSRTSLENNSTHIDPKNVKKIEDIINGKYNEGRNLFGKALATGIPSIEELIRNVLQLFLSMGVSRDNTKKLGVILLNLRYEDLIYLLNEVQKAPPSLTPDQRLQIAKQIATFLLSKNKKGGKRTRKARKTRRTRHTRSTRRF